MYHTFYIRHLHTCHKKGLITQKKCHLRIVDQRKEYTLFDLRQLQTLKIAPSLLSCPDYYNRDIFAKKGIDTPTHFNRRDTM